MSKDHYKKDNQGREYAGDHILIDMHGAYCLSDLIEIEINIERAAGIAGAEIINSSYHSFGVGQGVSGVTTLAESHISVHTWPEREFAAFDVFMCGKADADKAAKELIFEFNPDTFTIKKEKRGADPDQKNWGQHLVLDLKGCSKNHISNSENILNWCGDLVRAIGMKAYGEPILKHFATHSHSAAGYTLIQLIETSNICAHFAENNGAVYIDIFSCKPFDVTLAEMVCMKYFKPKIIDKKSIIRE